MREKLLSDLANEKHARMTEIREARAILQDAHEKASVFEVVAVRELLSQGASQYVTVHWSRIHAELRYAAQEAHKARMRETRKPPRELDTCAK